MIKFKTLGMFEVSKNDPAVKAHDELPNGYFCTVEGGVTVAPTGDTVKGAGLKLVVKEFCGDERYVDVNIPKGDYVVAYDLEANGGQRLLVAEEHLAADVATYAVDSLLAVDTAGKLAAIGAATGYALYFKVVGTVLLGTKKALDVEIVNASAATTA